jgi:hypothetical protein
MRCAFIVLIFFTSALFAHELYPTVPDGRPDLSTPKLVTAYVNEEAELLAWPDCIVKKEIGADREKGRLCGYCVLHLKTLDLLDAGALVLKATVLFASAVSENARIDQLCVTMKCGDTTARLFVPIEVLKKIGAELDDNVLVPLELKKELVTSCDWKEIDALIERSAFYQLGTGMRTPAPPMPDKNTMLTRFVLIDGREVFASANLEAGENYVVMDDTGRFVRLRKPDVAMVLK